VKYWYLPSIFMVLMSPKFLERFCSCYHRELCVHCDVVMVGRMGSIPQMDMRFVIWFMQTNRQSLDRCKSIIDCNQSSHVHATYFSISRSRPTQMGHETQRLAIPKTTKQLIVEIPSSHVLLITLNRPKALNAMTPEMHQGIELVVDWFLEEPSLWYVYNISYGAILLIYSPGF